MKCPKCGYLGFEHVDRCRNCGYEFSLASSSQVAAELAIRAEAPPLRPLDNLSLVDAAAAPGRDGRMSPAGPDLDRLLGVPTARAAAPPSDELPLFGPPIPDEVPLITKASPPRPPLAVRRSTPDVPRLRAEPRVQSFDLVLEREAPAPRPRAATPAVRAVSAAGELSLSAPQDAALGARLAAVLIDLLILACIDALVVYFTAQICGITIQELGLLPKGPLVAFLFVQNVGYLVAFTAGGQTLGKMAAGIRVVPAVGDAPVDVGRACLRTLLWLVLAAPVGLGFLSAAFARDHRGLHDRFAGTRVVR